MLTIVVGEKNTGKTTVCKGMIDASDEKELVISMYNEPAYRYKSIKGTELMGFCCTGNMTYNNRVVFNASERDSGFEISAALNKMRNGHITIDSCSAFAYDRTDSIWIAIKAFVKHARHFGNSLTLVFNRFSEIPQYIFSGCDRLRLHMTDIGDLSKSYRLWGMGSEIQRKIELAVIEIAQMGSRYDCVSIDLNEMDYCNELSFEEKKILLLVA